MENIKETLEEKFTEEELTILKQRREYQSKIKECSSKIGDILKEYNLKLMVDPDSTINNIQIVVR